MYNSIIRRKGIVVPFDLSKEELQLFYAFLDRLIEAIWQEEEEPQAPPRPVLRLVKSLRVPQPFPALLDDVDDGVVEPGDCLIA